MEEALAPIGGDERGVIVLLDEVQEVLDHADDVHYDTASTAWYLVGWLHDHRRNPLMYLLSTCNSDKSFPDLIRSRFRGHIIRFEPISNADQRKAAFIEHMKLQDIALDNSCDVAFLDSQMSQLDGWVGRDFFVLASSVVDAYQDGAQVDLDNIVVSREHVQQGIRKIQQDIEEEKRDKPLSNEAQREREYEQREKQHRDNIRVQLLTMSRQQPQTSFGVNGGASIGKKGVSYSVSGSASRTSAPGLTGEGAQEIFEEAFPDEQLERSSSALRSTQGSWLSNRFVYPVVVALTAPTIFLYGRYLGSQPAPNASDQARDRGES